VKKKKETDEVFRFPSHHLSNFNKRGEMNGQRVKWVGLPWKMHE